MERKRILSAWGIRKRNRCQDSNKEDTILINTGEGVITVQEALKEGNDIKSLGTICFVFFQREKKQT